MYKLLVGATVLSLLASCSKTVPYTLQLQEKHHLSIADISNLQYFLSDQVVLYEVNPQRSTEVIDGELETSSKALPKRVVIPAGTPGRAVLTSANRLGICFEADTRKFLVFGTEEQGGVYYLQAKEWEKGHGVVKYGDDEWFVTPGSGAAYIQIKQKEMNRPEKTTTVVKGRTQ